VYSLHVGVKRHIGGVNRDTDWYRRINQTSIERGQREKP
jgi:hypothetical protein